MASQKKESGKRLTLARFMPWLLVVGGCIGLLCSFIIMFEKLALLQNASYSPSCNLNPIISCGSVMASDQANAFGFPNPILGLIGFPVLIASGMALFAGAKFKRWYWAGMEVGAFLGLLFVHWLFFQSVYHIQALCPYCMVVWAVTITTFWYVTLYNIQLNFTKIPERFENAAVFVRKHHADILALWFLIILGLILKHFWYYYGSFFS